MAASLHPRDQTRAGDLFKGGLLVTRPESSLQQEPRASGPPSMLLSVLINSHWVAVVIVTFFFMPAQFGVLALSLIELGGLVLLQRRHQPLETNTRWWDSL